ncbi:MAG: hypothetical protein DHS20C17_21860 [Cyclobacteriaceae bacterium]|nr:MAG: hypothetical protein DHS20C17_21860 [Cyclobacteriaceae bacterium]
MYVYKKMLKRHIWSAMIIMALIGGIMSCDIQDNTVEPEDVFTRVYNNDNFSDAFYPINIAQTADSGYLILGGKEVSDTQFLSAYLIKVNSEGDFVWEQSPSENYVNPLSGLSLSGNSYRFFCMDKLNLGTYLVRVDDASGGFTEIGYLGGLQYPLAANNLSGGGYVVQGYNREDQKTVMARLNENAVAIWQEEYDTFEDVEEDIIKHMIRTSRPLPFMTGSVDNSFFFNGFYNYSFSMGFVNASDGTLTGVINGPGIEDAVSAAMQISGNKFAMARYSYLENKIIPSYNLNVTGTQVTSDLEGLKFGELSQQAKFQIKKINVASKSIAVYGTETKSGQVLLLAYDLADQSLLGSRYLGHGQPYRMADFSVTKDGGLIVLASTDITGRFPRLALFKLSKNDLEMLAGIQM